MRLTGFFISFWLLAVVARPSRSRTRDEINNTNHTISNDGTLYSPSGPPELVTRFIDRLQPLDVRLTLEAVFGAIARQSLTVDWNSRFRDPSFVFNGDNGHKILVQAATSEPMEQRFAIWALVRLMDEMVRNDRFFATQAVMHWRGNSIGSVSIGRDRFGDMGSNSFLPGIELKTLNTSSNVGANRVSFEDVEFLGTPNPMPHVFIGSIVSLVQAYERPHSSSVFNGNWPDAPYSIFQAWWSPKRSSLIYKEVLLRAIVAALEYADVRENWRCSKGVIRIKGRDVAEGGMTRFARYTDRNGSQNMAVS